MNHIRIYNAIYGRIFNLIYRNFFKHLGKKSFVISPVAIEGFKNIYIGDSTYIATGSCLAAVALTGMSSSLTIGNGCSIGRYNHFYATHSIKIGNNVLTANGVYISDNLHDYSNPNIPVANQNIIQKNLVEIGENSWIGHNACIIGVSIGKHCVIGANSVVTHDIPDYCVVIGAPAYIIKRFNTSENMWMPTNPDGSYKLF